MTDWALSAKGSTVMWSMLLRDMMKEERKEDDEGNNSDK